MSGKEIDLQKLDKEFEILIAIGKETDDFKEKGVSGTICGKNWGESCGHDGNNPCNRGEWVVQCNSESRTVCPKVNEQGCHPAVITETRSRP